MLLGSAILLCFVSLILADNPLDILKDEFTIIRPFTVLENNATFYCKVTISKLLNSLVIRQSSGSHQAVNCQSSGSHHIFRLKGLKDLNLSHLRICVSFLSRRKTKKMCHVLSMFLSKMK